LLGVERIAAWHSRQELSAAILLQGWRYTQQPAWLALTSNPKYEEISYETAGYKRRKKDVFICKDKEGLPFRANRYSAR
jgi:hypothetical protein